MCEVEPMCVDADGVGCGRRGALLSPGWEDVYMDVDGVGCGRRGALLSPGWEDVYMDVAVAWLGGCVYGCCCRLVEGMCIWMRMVLGVDGEARCCRLVEDFFYFLLAAGWGLHV